MTHPASVRYWPVSTRIALALGLVLVAGCERGAGQAAADTAQLEPPRSIGAVQGRGRRSPYDGQKVSVQGVVTGNFVAGLDGFFMQDATGAEDGDPATADGIFVEHKRYRAPKLRRGDRVRVLGSVVERGEGEATLTTLAGAEIEVLGRGGVSISTIEAAPASPADWERWEGMWLRFAAPLTVTGNHALLSDGVLDVALGRRLWAATERDPPGAKAREREADNARRHLLLDDGRNIQYPDKRWLLAEDLAPERPLRAGSVLQGVEGVLDQRHGRWRLQLTEKLRQIDQAPRPALAELPVGLRIASFNLHNLFNGNGRGGGFPTARGAASRTDYERQRAKLVAGLTALSADVLALSELENDGQAATSAESALLAALNANLGEAGDYRAVTVTPEQAGTDQIRLGLWYRDSAVEPQGEARSLDDPLFAQARPPLAQDFRLRDGGATFTVVAVHLKSKRCEAEMPPQQQDQGDGQSCWNALRTEQVTVLERWLRGGDERAPLGRVVLLGDFNAYRQEDPLRLLDDRGWHAALDELRPRAYSYVFNGRAGRLDHAWLSPSLAPALLAATTWAINADESEAFDYRSRGRPSAWYQTDPYASSDHDPLLLVLRP